MKFPFFGGGGSPDAGGLLAEPRQQTPLQGLLAEYQAAMAPSEDERRRAMNEGLFRAGLSMLSTRGVAPAQGIASGIGQGMDTYNQRLAQARQDKAGAFELVGKLKQSAGQKKMGLQPVWMKDKDGNLIPGQLSDSGGLEVAPLPEGFTAAPQVSIEDFGGYRQGYDKFGRPVGPAVDKTQTPDSLVANDPKKQRELAEAKAEGGAIGAGQGAQVIKDDRQLADASEILGVLDEAEPLIRKSTGSGIGAAGDAVAGAFGVSTEGAEAIDQLTILGQKLTMKVPRFEGPQSNIDVRSYEKAAGDLANPAVPRERRLASLAIVRKLNEKYLATRPGTSAPAPTKPAAQLPSKGVGPAYQEYMDAYSRAKTPEQKAAINARARQNGVIR